MRGSVQSLSGRVFSRRVESVEWPGGQLQVTLCRVSQQLVIRQGRAEVSIPAKRWPEIEELAARLVLPKVEAKHGADHSD